nr:multidrug transporter subunit MdtD [Paraburkholderia caballeronis]
MRQPSACGSMDTRMTRDSAHKALLWIVATAFFMQSLDTTIVNTALPSIAQSLHESALAMQPVIVGYTLTMAILTPASGWLADRFGTRRVYFVAILIFVIGSVCCAGAHTLGQLIVARVLQGVGGSMLLPIGRLAVLRSVSAEQYVSALAFVSIAGQVGPLLGPTLGGWLTQTISWHWIFLINVPIGLAGLAATQFFLPHDHAVSAPPFDLAGCALLSLGMSAFSLGVDVPASTNRAAWATVCFALSVASFLAYVVHAKYRTHPLFRLGLFREPNFSVGLVGNLLCRIGANAVPFMVPLMLQVQLGYSPLRSGLTMLPAALAGTMTKRWVAPLIRRFGYGTFLLVNTAIVGLSIAAFSLVSKDSPALIALVVLAVFGAATSMQFAAMNSVTLKGLSHADAGSGNSLFSMAQMLAMGLGVSIGGGVVRLFASEWGSTQAGFRVSFICMGVITLLSAVVFRWLDAVKQPASTGLKQAQ